MASCNIGDINLNEITQIRNELNFMLKISNEIEIIRSNILLSLPNDTNLDENLNNLNEKSSQLKSISISIRYLLSQMKLNQTNSYGINYRINQTNLKYFYEQYNLLLNKINEKNQLYRLLIKQRLDRQLYLLGRPPSTDQLDQFIVVPDIIIHNEQQLNLLYNNKKEQIHYLENTLKEMKDLFDDFNYFIECQNEIINSIDEKILDSQIKF